MELWEIVNRVIPQTNIDIRDNESQKLLFSGQADEISERFEEYYSKYYFTKVKSIYINGNILVVMIALL